jgi:membrane protease YdiL (CAAX protease family)
VPTILKNTDSSIQGTKLGDIGAVIITSLTFTSIHTQYNNPISLIFILTLGLLLGFVRYKTKNISYAIMIHIFYNSLVMIGLFYF